MSWQKYQTQNYSPTPLREEITCLCILTFFKCSIYFICFNFFCIYVIRVIDKKVETGSTGSIVEELFNTLQDFLQGIFWGKNMGVKLVNKKVQFLFFYYRIECQLLKHVKLLKYVLACLHVTSLYHNE